MSSKRIEDDGPDVQGAWSDGVGCVACGSRLGTDGGCACVLRPSLAQPRTQPIITVTGWPFQQGYPATPQPQPGISPHAPGVVPDDRFASLRQEMDAAFAQAASGKGMERHGDDGRFEDQTTVRMARELGTAFPVGQACKKLIEGERMARAGNVAGALREWHGAMVYAAMACIVGRR